MAENPPSDIVRNGNSQQLQLLKNIHDEGYLYVSQGLSYQEQEVYDLARDMYERGLEKIERALQIKCDESYCVGPEWENARKLQKKMKSTSELIKSHLLAISSKSPSNNPPYTPPEPFEPPPSYDEAVEHDIICPRRASYPCIGNGFAPPSNQPMSDVTELFSIPGEVQLFFVAYDGSVSTTFSATSLFIYEFADEVASSEERRPPAWLQIGSWTYPLVPGQSPALESGYGAFLFPNVGAGRDSAVGVILPSSVTPSQRAEFLSILNRLTAFREEKRVVPFAEGAFPDSTETKPQSFSETLSKGIVTGAEYLSAGIVKGASMSSDLIHKGASKARQKIRPEEKAVSVDPRVREGLRIAHEASGVALKATGYLVRKLGDLTVALGKQIAPHIRDQSTRLLTSTLQKDPADAKDTVDGVLTVAAGGLQGFSTIYMGLENAARQLAYSLSTETVNIVGHKYGGEVGEVVGNAVGSVGNLALTTHNVQSLGVKAIAKRTAKDAGKEVLKDYVENVKMPDK